MTRCYSSLGVKEKYLITREKCLFACTRIPKVKTLHNNKTW